MKHPILVASLALALAACQGTEAPHTGADSTAAAHAGHGMTHDSTSAMPYSDVMHLDHMIEHHQMALDMARAVGERGASPEVRQLAQAVIRSQATEIDSMKAWRARWFADAPASPAMPAEHAAMMGMHMDMTGLQATSGAELDRLFLLDMIPHHGGAVMMASHAQKMSRRPEIVALSRSIIAEQAREIGEMQRLLTAMPADSTAR